MPREAKSCFSFYPQGRAAEAGHEHKFRNSIIYCSLWLYTTYDIRLPLDRLSSGMIPLQDGSAHLPRRPLLRSGLHPSRALFGHRDHNIRFHLLHKKCGSRVRNQLFCPVCKVVIERDETVRGYEVSKGQYVRVEDAELEALEAEANTSIDIREFILSRKSTRSAPFLS